MECLKVLFEDTGMQSFIESKEPEIVGGAEAFHQFPQIVKDYVSENLSDFIGNTVEETHQNIAEFTETAAFQYLSDIVDAIAA